jgi:dihydrofolate reductase
MAQVRVHNFSISLDGYAAGPGQGVDTPLGVGGLGLHEWFFADDIDPVDKDFVDRAFENVGATVMGRNMFGPVRGTWESWESSAEEWRGWWGPNPPFHNPVFVLTHHAHEPIEMAGGTTFHFVNEPVEAAVERALAAAGGQDVAVAGGASVVRAGLRAGVIDEVDVVVAPLLLGGGERLFDPADGVPRGYEVSGFTGTTAVGHYRLTKAL